MNKGFNSKGVCRLLKDLVWYDMVKRSFNWWGQDTRDCNRILFLEEKDIPFKSKPK